ncbi:MAG: cation-translocating P-type ATPase [Eubacterium sp.]|nr:cation-translocating P-type ATPase [Eubacterium sp.]
MKKLEALLELGGTKRDIVFLIISAIALLISITKPFPLPFDAAWIAVILCGLPIVLGAIVGLVTEFDITADVLVSIALVASLFIGEDFAAGEVAFIMQLGALLEELTVKRARAGIEKLVKLTPRTARIITENGENVVAAEAVKVGDVIRVLPGETIPVDGIILKGETAIDQSVMTGESIPVDKSVGDEVASGTVNQFGAFDMEAVKVGEDSAIQRMIRLVASADADKAKIVGLADRWAVWIVIIALSAAAITWLVTGEIIRAVTILVVFCPCSLVLATPTAIMAAIGNATGHGFLVKEGDALERLAAVSKVTFDKTGTLTRGIPRVVAVKSLYSEVSEDRLYGLCAAAEKNSEHPLGKAILRCYKEDKGDSVQESADFTMIPGQGIAATVEGKRVVAGSIALLQGQDILVDDGMKMAAETYLDDGCTVVYTAVDGRAAGFIAIADTPRASAQAVIAGIKAAGITPVLLTGDNPRAAEKVAGMLGIDEVHAELLPEDKLGCIDTFQSQGSAVCMVGDGINDAPALKKAQVGIAMGGVGSDIAVDAADIALTNDDIAELPHLLRLAKRMMSTIKLNLTFSMTLNFVAIVLAITGILNPVVGAFVHNAGSVVVIVNSALLLKWHGDKKHKDTQAPAQKLAAA